MFDGEGKYTYKDGTQYVGDFYGNEMWGQGTITYPEGGEIDSYEGQVSSGGYNGVGTVFYANGVIYKGFFLNGLKNGFGVLIYGSSKYKCLFVMNKLIGEIKSML